VGVDGGLEVGALKGALAGVDGIFPISRGFVILNWLVFFGHVGL
jgi:hypothetical protein